jgi:hypothetical protein
MEQVAGAHVPKIVACGAQGRPDAVRIAKMILFCSENGLATIMRRATCLPWTSKRIPKEN